MNPEGKRHGDISRKVTGTGNDASSNHASSEGYLDGRLLVAMPVMGDPRFERSVIYLCAHSAEGAMGIMVNTIIEASLLLYFSNFK